MARNTLDAQARYQQARRMCFLYVSTDVFTFSCLLSDETIVSNGKDTDLQLRGSLLALQFSSLEY